MTAQSAPDVNDHELWYRAYEFAEAVMAGLDPRLVFILVDVMVSTGVARELLDSGRLPTLATDEESLLRTG